MSPVAIFRSPVKSVAIALAVIAFAVLPSSAQTARPGTMVEFHYSPAENLERYDVALIGDAGETIDMAAYVLTDVPVINALRDAALRGVKVRIYRSAEEHNNYSNVIAALDALLAVPGVEMQTRRNTVFMHLKSYCVDGAVLRAGAANFSASGLKQQDNDLEIMRGGDACAAFERNFKMLWTRGD